jgi:2-polyprenyl-6-hydroxyphenyl methylase/3-demethylubiquinone-9 3-methyltransferase
MAKNVICLWYDGTAEEAARFFAQTFPDSALTAVHRAPGDYPDGETDRYWNAIVGNGGAESACGWVQGQMGLVLADHPTRTAGSNDRF